MINFSSPLDGGHGQQGQPLCKAHTCKRRGGGQDPLWPVDSRRPGLTALRQEPCLQRSNSFLEAESPEIFTHFTFSQAVHPFLPLDGQWSKARLQLRGRARMGEIPRLPSEAAV